MLHPTEIIVWARKKKKKKVETLFKIIFYMRVPQEKKSNAGLDQHEGVYMMKEL